MVDWVVLGACGPGVLPESLPVAGICIKLVMLVPNKIDYIIDRDLFQFKLSFTKWVLNMRLRNLVSESTLKCSWDTVAKCCHTWSPIFWTWCKLVSPLTMQMHLPFIAVMCTFKVDLAHYQGSYKVWNFTMIFLGMLIKVCHMAVLQIGSQWILVKKQKRKGKGNHFVDPKRN